MDPGFRCNEKYLSQIPALHLLIALRYTYLPAEQVLAASLAHAEIVDAQTSPERCAELREQLLACFARDTEAMVKVYQALRQLV